MKLKRSPSSGLRLLARQIGTALIAIAAVVVMVTLAPGDTVTSADVADVMVDDTLNQARTEGAPQQSVVNGWTARDLLRLSVVQGTEARDHRPSALLLLLVLGMCLALATTEPPPRETQPDAYPQPPITPSAHAIALGAHRSTGTTSPRQGES